MFSMVPYLLGGAILALEDLSTKNLDQSPSIQQIIGNVTGFIISGAASVAVLVLVIGGVMYMLSGGNEKTAGTAKRILYSAIIGLVIIIFSYTIVNIVVANVPNWLNK